PIGFGFGHWDGIGKYQDLDNNVSVDASGEITNANPDVAGTFNGTDELAQRLSGSTEVKQCIALQTIRYAFGRAEVESDACSLQNLYQAFASKGFSVKELMVSIAESDSFTHRRAVVAGQ